MGESFTFKSQLLVYSHRPARSQVASDLAGALARLRELPPYRGEIAPGWMVRGAHIAGEHFAGDFPLVRFPGLAPMDGRAARALLAELRTALGHLREAHRQIHILEDLGRDEPLCTAEGKNLAAVVLDYAQTVNGLLA